MISTEQAPTFAAGGSARKRVWPRNTDVAYCASTAAVESLGDSLRIEIRPTGAKVGTLRGHLQRF